MESKIILIGAGGHCSSVIDSLVNNDKYEIVGILDKADAIGSIVAGIEIIGTDDDLVTLKKRGINKCFVCIGSIGDYTLRKKVIEKASEIGYEFINVIDKSANVSNSITLGQGVFIGKNVVLNANVVVKDYAIINTASVIEHDCVIEQFCHIAPGSVIAGSCCIKSGTHIGINSTVIQGVMIGRDCMIGAGSIVLSDVKDNEKKWGVIHEK